MTNEQAKKMIKAKLECLKRETSGTDFDCNNSNCDECSLCYEQGNMGEQKEALDMAIKSLEQQPCEDTISRQAAIDAVGSMLRRKFGIGGDLAEITLAGLPSAQPERKKPVFKTGESVYHVSYANGTGGFKKNQWADWTCPDCGWFVGEQYIPRRHNQQKCNYCAKCGCAIDWSDVDMRGEQDE